MAAIICNFKRRGVKPIQFEGEMIKGGLLHESFLRRVKTASGGMADEKRDPPGEQLYDVTPAVGTQQTLNKYELVNILTHMLAEPSGKLGETIFKGPLLIEAPDALPEVCNSKSKKQKTKHKTHIVTQDIPFSTITFCNTLREAMHVSSADDDTSDLAREISQAKMFLDLKELPRGSLLLKKHVAWCVGIRTKVCVARTQFDCDMYFVFGIAVDRCVRPFRRSKQDKPTQS